MMNWRNLLWWALYTCIGISLQAVLPGLDFLLPGLILAIQERKKNQFLWIAVLFLLIQEGSGSMMFGSTLVSYALAPALFYVGYSLFEVDSFPFIGLLSLCLGIVHYVTTALMSSLQDIPFHAPLVMDESVIQTLMTPFLWRFAQFTLRFCHETRV